MSNTTGNQNISGDLSVSGNTSLNNLSTNSSVLGSCIVNDLTINNSLSSTGLTLNCRNVNVSNNISCNSLSVPNISSTSYNLNGVDLGTRISNIETINSNQTNSINTINTSITNINNTLTNTPRLNQSNTFSAIDNRFDIVRCNRLESRTGDNTTEVYSESQFRVNNSGFFFKSSQTQSGYANLQTFYRDVMDNQIPNINSNTTSINTINNTTIPNLQSNLQNQITNNTNNITTNTNNITTNTNNITTNTNNINSLTTRITGINYDSNNTASTLNNLIVYNSINNVGILEDTITIDGSITSNVVLSYPLHRYYILRGNQITLTFPTPTNALIGQMIFIKRLDNIILDNINVATGNSISVNTNIVSYLGSLFNLTTTSASNVDCNQNVIQLLVSSINNYRLMVDNPRIYFNFKKFQYTLSTRNSSFTIDTNQSFYLLNPTNSMSVNFPSSISPNDHGMVLKFRRLVSGVTITFNALGSSHFFKSDNTTDSSFNLNTYIEILISGINNWYVVLNSY
jgi:hypothetical protein